MDSPISENIYSSTIKKIQMEKITRKNFTSCDNDFHNKWHSREIKIHPRTYTLNSSATPRTHQLERVTRQREFSRLTPEGIPDSVCSLIVAVSIIIVPVSLGCITGACDGATFKPVFKFSLNFYLNTKKSTLDRLM